MQVNKAKMKVDWNDTVCRRCLNCEEGTMVECDGSCLRSFHLGCLAADERPRPNDPADAAWYCGDCRRGLASCSLCGVKGVAGVGLYKCRMGCCGRYFHTACLAAARPHLKFKAAPTPECLRALRVLSLHSGGDGTWGGAAPDDAEFSEEECLQGRIMCPAHYCQSCHMSGDSLKLLGCWMCCRAYHTGCMPDLSERSDAKSCTCPWCRASYRAEQHRQETDRQAPLEPQTEAGGKPPRRRWDCARVAEAVRRGLRAPDEIDLSILRGHGGDADGQGGGRRGGGGQRGGDRRSGGGGGGGTVVRGRSSGGGGEGGGQGAEEEDSVLCVTPLAGSGGEPPAYLMGKTRWHFGTHTKGGGVDFLVPVEGVKLHSQLAVDKGVVTLRAMHTSARAPPPLLNGSECRRGEVYFVEDGDVIDIAGARYAVTRIARSSVHVVERVPLAAWAQLAAAEAAAVGGGGGSGSDWGGSGAGGGAGGGVSSQPRRAAPRQPLLPLQAPSERAGGGGRGAKAADGQAAAPGGAAWGPARAGGAAATRGVDDDDDDVVDDWPDTTRSAYTAYPQHRPRGSGGGGAASAAPAGSDSQAPPPRAGGRATPPPGTSGQRPRGGTHDAAYPHKRSKVEAGEQGAQERAAWVGSREVGVEESGGGGEWNWEHEHAAAALMALAKARAPGGRRGGAGARGDGGAAGRGGGAEGAGSERGGGAQQAAAEERGDSPGPQQRGVERAAAPAAPTAPPVSGAAAAPAAASKLTARRPALRSTGPQAGTGVAGHATQFGAPIKAEPQGQALPDGAAAVHNGLAAAAAAAATALGFHPHQFAAAAALLHSIAGVGGAHGLMGGHMLPGSPGMQSPQDWRQHLLMLHQQQQIMQQMAQHNQQLQWQNQQMQELLYQQQPAQARTASKPRARPASLQLPDKHVREAAAEKLPDAVRSAGSKRKADEGALGPADETPSAHAVATAASVLPMGQQQEDDWVQARQRRRLDPPQQQEQQSPGDPPACAAGWPEVPVGPATGATGSRAPPGPEQAALPGVEASCAPALAPGLSGASAAAALTGSPAAPVGAPGLGAMGGVDLSAALRAVYRDGVEAGTGG